jgi:hypothetical protein
MKDECDKNGLEYELLMQETTKDRFMRQVQAHPELFSKFNKNFYILKQKRDSEDAAGVAPQETSAVEPKSEVLGAPAPESAAPAAAEPQSSVLGVPLSALTASTNGKLAIAGLSALSPSKLMMSIRDRLSPSQSIFRSLTTPRSIFATQRSAPVSIPTFALPSLSATTRSPFSWNLLGSPNTVITQPPGTVDDE